MVMQPRGSSKTWGMLGRQRSWCTKSESQQVRNIPGSGRVDRNLTNCFVRNFYSLVFKNNMYFLISEKYTFFSYFSYFLVYI
jgi:hypothetical protein